MTGNFEFTKVFYDLVEAAKDNRYLILYGGSSSSKSISILQWLTLYAFKHKNKRIAIIGESFPVLRKTVIPDWQLHVMKELFVPTRFNYGEMVYTFPTGSKIMFMPGDTESRFHGMRSDIAYFDEIFYVKKQIFDQVDIRCNEKVFCSFNPTSEFWIKDNFDDPKTSVMHSTYRDNKFITQNIKDALEKRASKDENFHRVYNLGQWGSLEGMIFEEGQHWSVVDKVPIDSKKNFLGLDFGYSVDPAAIIDVHYSQGELWLDELVYEREMLNPELLPFLKKPTIADSAEPKSIAELRNAGVNIIGAKKGADSIRNGLSLMKQFKINITKRSINLIKEFRNYRWAQNRQGERETRPIDDWNHGIDAVRYVTLHMFNEKNVFFV